MLYVADTMALVWHLEKRRRLGAQARRVLQEADQGHHTIVISGATLMEILYLSERQRISVDLMTLKNFLTASQSYSVAPVGFDVVAASALIDDIPELHDRVIAGTAVWLNIPILTNDPDMTASRHVQTVWR
jgi:PIN domain nuclease of toxin-antitoxin system